MKTVLLALLSSVIIAVAACEITLRLFFSVPQIEILLTDVSNDSASAQLRYAVVENPLLVYVPKPGKRGDGGFNEYGYRGAPVRVERTPGKVRIVYIGDSVVEGLRVEEKERFTSLLQDRLGDGYETVNLAVRGYNLKQELEYLKQYGLKYSPDRVVLGVTYNDLAVSASQMTSLQQRLKSRQRFIPSRPYRWLLKHSELARLSFFLLFAPESAVDVPDIANVRVAGPELDAIAAEFVRLSAERNFKLNVVLLPVNLNARTDAMNRIGDVFRTAGAEVYDLNTETIQALNSTARGRLFMQRDPCHLNSQGHRYVADKLALKLFLPSQSGD